MLKAILLMSLVGSSVHADLSGLWRGFYETPSGLAAMDLSFRREGLTWKGEFSATEVETDNRFSIANLKISETEISFTAGDDRQSWQMHFSGRLLANRLEGTFEMLQSGKGAYKGLWSAKRVRQASSTPVAPADERSSVQPPPEQTTLGLMAKLPPPTGPLLVGRSTFFWKDSTRLETMTGDPSDYRKLMVSLWYPAQRGGNMIAAAYFPHFDLLKTSSSGTLPVSLKTHAFEQALPSQARQRFPVLLFSHGLGENTARYSSILEELASHGYLVAAIDHTYDNQGTVFPDGRVVRLSDRWGRAFSGSTSEQERFIIERLSVWFEDVSFVLNRLEVLNGESGGIFSGKLDMSRTGFFGHSLGGAVALLACQKDVRLKACLNMDGMPTSRALIVDPTLKFNRPFMFLTENPSPTELELERRALTRSEYGVRDRARRRRMFRLLDTSTTESYLVLIPGAQHSSFSDHPLLESQSSSAYKTREKTLQVIRDYTRAFFDKYLNAETTKLIDNVSAEYPGVTIDRFGATTGH